jgi:hypothetical protein
MNVWVIFCNDINLLAREVVVGWLIFWFVNVELKGSIPSCDILFMF